MYQHLQQGLLKQGLLGPLQVSDAVALGWSLRICISNEFLGGADAEAAGPGSPHWEAHFNSEGYLLEVELSECVPPGWRATFGGPVPMYAGSYDRGPIWRTDCLEQTVVKFDAFLHTKSSVAITGRYRVFTRSQSGDLRIRRAPPDPRYPFFVSPASGAAAWNPAIPVEFLCEAPLPGLSTNT